MIIHRADSRGLADHGWLHSRHTFSFADYVNPERMNFGKLRVINDDRVAPSKGFGMHPHRDMEIITIPLAGTLHHKDSEGHEKSIRHGEVQLMSAGTGVLHSEFNESAKEDVELLQIWVMPKKLGIKPRYEQQEFNFAPNRWQVVVSPIGAGQEGVTINQDAYFSLGQWKQVRTSYEVKVPSNGIYLFVIKGHVLVNGEKIQARDAVGIEGQSKIDIEIPTEAEVLVIEVPMK